MALYRVRCADCHGLDGTGYRGPDLVAAIGQLITTGAYGIYHFTNTGSCSRFEFAQEILRQTGQTHVPIEPITLADIDRPSMPPPYTPLRNFCGAQVGINLRPWQDALADYLAHERFESRD